MQFDSRHSETLPSPKRLYITGLIPKAAFSSRPWIDQFVPFIANPLFILRLAVYGPFINPTLRPISGLIGSDKALILNAFPESVRGVVRIFDSKTLSSIASMPMPYYVKPTVGERAVDVYRIGNTQTFDSLVTSHIFDHGSWIAQEAFAGTEFGVSVVRSPIDKKLSIAFLTEKIITGSVDTASIANGATFRELLGSLEPNAIASLEKILADMLDASPLLTDFYAGRFDMKAINIDMLLGGQFNLIELNGIGGMPLVYFEPDPYDKWNSYFLTLLAIGKANMRRFSFRDRIARICADTPRALGLIFKQKHFRQYWKTVKSEK